MKQRTFLDLTPLLDVVLILLFAFMLSINASGTDRETELVKKTMNNEALRQMVEMRNDQISELEKQLTASKDDNIQLEKQLEDMTMSMDVERDSLDAITSQLTKWFGDTSLNTIANEKMLEQFLDKESVYEELYKYDTLAKRYFFVDVKLKSSDNELFINDESSHIYITREDILSDEKLIFKKEQIQEAIDRVLSDREGGYTFVLITLSQEGNVYRLAYNAIWDAITAIEVRYGTEKIFKTKYKSPRITVPPTTH